MRLSDAGRELVDEIVVHHVHGEQELLDARLTRAEQEQLAALLATFLENSGDVSAHDPTED